MVTHHKPAVEPRSRLGSKMPPETEPNKETRPDQAAGDVLQPPLTKTNPGEENLLEGDTQVSEDKTPGGTELDL
uniref:CD48 molecule n=1 Tax=Nothobranchius pienaari TaxID=704102 RepID=A0A1A8R5C1_9TELE